MENQPLISSSSIPLMFSLMAIIKYTSSVSPPSIKGQPEYFKGSPFGTDCALMALGLPCTFFHFPDLASLPLGG